MAAAVACAVLAAAIFLPGPWSIVAAGMWTLAFTSYILWRRAVRTDQGSPADFLSREKISDKARSSSTSIFHLELRSSRFVVSRFDEAGPVDSAALFSSQEASFPTRALLSVLDADFAGHRAVVEWTFASMPVPQLPGHPAEKAYGELLGPLEIIGRYRHILELHIDASALPTDDGTVEQAAAAVRDRIKGLLAHAGLCTLSLCEADRADLYRIWSTASHAGRVLVTASRPLQGARTGQRFVLSNSGGASASASNQSNFWATTDMLPAQGSGPIIGADDNDRALCVDLCGPHIRTSILTGRFDTLEFLILRQCALGWRTAAITDDPDRWHGLAGAAGVDVVYSDFAVDNGRGFTRLRGLDRALGCDMVFWDSVLEVPEELSDHRSRPTVCRVLTGDPAEIERRFAQPKMKDVDLLVDGRVSGWFTIHTRPDLSGARPRSITVQAVETAAEIACLAAGRAEPKPLATLTT